MKNPYLHVYLLKHKRRKSRYLGQKVTIMCRGGLELAHPLVLEPESSASTNSATRQDKCSSNKQRDEWQTRNQMVEE